MQIGIDLGASKIEYVLLDDTGNEHQRERLEVPKDYERTVSTLLAGGSDPVISKKPTGAWTHEITDLALK